jgi:16S rRNA (guanine527-N7)-methyltransferase
LNQVISRLRQGIAGMNLPIPAATIDQLTHYLALLVKWNRVYNLTGIRNHAKLVTHHLLDCLAVIEHLPPGNVVDVGSGAGLPGVPIAITCPGRYVTLLDSNQKKSAFLRQVVAELGLSQANVISERVEAHRPTALFKIVISRAFSDLAGFVKLAGHLCAPDGVMIAMKGLNSSAELADLPSSWQVSSTVHLQVPELEASRHLVFVRPLSTAAH